MTEHIPHLRVEREAGMVVVSQSKAGVVSPGALHPIHVRHLAELVGLAPSSAPAAAKQIATLGLRLRMLHRRVDELGTDLTNCPDLDHALEQALALAETCDAYIADLPDLLTDRLMKSLASGSV
jgi:hypothetical protein